MSTLLSKFDEAAKKGAKNCRDLRLFLQNWGEIILWPSAVSSYKKHQPPLVPTTNGGYFC